MNMSLYRTMMKSNMKSFINFGLGSAVYVTLMTSLFPMIADNMEEINSMTELFPEALMRAMGLESFSSYGQFISAEYYGLFFIFILGVFAVMTAVQLLAKLVDRGSMAYLLSTKVSRANVAFTQAMVLITGLAIIILMTIAGGLLAGGWLIDEQYSIEIGNFLQINVLGFLLFFAVGGYSFLISSMFNDEKRAFAVAGALTFVFYGLDMAGKIVLDVDWLRNFSIFSLYEPGKIASGDANLWFSTLILTSIGVVSFLLAVLVFKRRNLPL
ncbi:ABC transporter permease subunit [Pseudalkalibacillus berkeleyi]|uniref:ABC transporter permease n=1 Tax=Pseudalkalibacillus berkeleyi TaxID=1069813 RepID=A0ABS9GUG5_9BACL|nr:ABC transporter permease subunit [Pseudalkalibacillus berkeleyi]MCF6136483.1 ABC transporter permease [Pseudalkalibacillus berkeleyi]